MAGLFAGVGFKVEGSHSLGKSIEWKRIKIEGLDC